MNNKQTKLCDRCERTFPIEIIDKNNGYCELCYYILNKNNKNEEPFDELKYTEDLYGKFSSRIHTDGI